MSSHLPAAWGGIIGPAAFVSAWVVGSVTKPGYSPVENAISQLAAIGSSTRPLMTAGFVGMGLAVPVYASALRKAVPGPAWKTAFATGAASLVVAALPLNRSTTIDSLHAGFAAFGYLTLAATPLLAARPLAARGHHAAARGSAIAGAASGLCLVASLLGPAHGLLQRAGLTIGDAWLMSSAVWMLSGRLVPDAPVAAPIR